MVECWLPYGKTESHLSIPMRDLIGTIEPPRNQPIESPFEIINNSIKNPINSEKLSELKKNKPKAVIAVEGTIKPSLAVLAITSIIDELEQSGVQKEKISILIGNGLRFKSNPELIRILKESEPLTNLHIEEHTQSSVNLESLGVTSRGTMVNVNKHFTDSNIRVIIGETNLDYFCGIKGAYTTILPSISSVNTIEKNYNLSFSGDSAPGVWEGNLVYEDAIEAAKMANIDMAINLITNAYGELLKIYSGDLVRPWEMVLEDISSLYKSKADSNADVIVVSAGGIKFDYDLFHSVWALDSVAKIAKKGASIILLAECSEGLGAPGLERLSLVDQMSELKRRYMLGAKTVYLIKSMIKNNPVVLLSSLPDYLVEPLGFSVAKAANDAFEMVTEHRRNKKTLVVTHGCSLQLMPY